MATIVAEQFDLLILGGGKGGKTLAMDQARQGKRVAVVEEGMIGGSCINIACIPSKALIRSAERAALVREAGTFGVRTGTFEIDMARVAARTAEVVADMVEFNTDAFGASGLELVIGFGRFVGPRIIRVEGAGGSRLLTAPRICINVGTHARIPDIPGLHEAEPLTHVEALKLDTLPERLLIIGAGYIGMEMAQAFRRLGSKVTLLNAGERLAEAEDPDVAVEIARLFDDEGIEYVDGARATQVRGTSGDQVLVRDVTGRAFEGSHLLVTAGRTPRTSGIGLDLTGVNLTPKGYIAVDDRLRTSAPCIWALGEIAGTPMFTHASLDDFRVVKSDFEGGSRTTRDRLIPSCLFIDPELARIGLTETDAARQGLKVRVASLPVDVIPRARTMAARRGIMKCVVAAGGDQILGFTMLGAHAGEVMAVVQTAMLGGLPYQVLRDAILAHPTMAEGLNMLLAKVPPRA